MSRTQFRRFEQNRSMIIICTIDLFVSINSFGLFVRLVTQINLYNSFRMKTVLFCIDSSYWLVHGNNFTLLFF